MTTVVIKKGEPIQLPNGDVIIPSSLADSVDGKPDVKPASTIKIEEELLDLLGDPLTETPYERTLAEINVPFNRMTTTMTIVGYNVWGLNASSIARVLDISEDQVAHVLETELAQRVRKEIIEAIRYAEAGAIQGYLQQKAVDAAKTIATAMGSKDGDRALRAAQDVLDRTGFRPVDRTEHIHKFNDEMRIVYIQEKELPTLTIDHDNF